MKQQNITLQNIVPFEGELDKDHRRLDPCFMTGKGCVYTEQIDNIIGYRKEERRNGNGKKEFRGFSIMPFRPNTKTFHRNCLLKYFEANFPEENPNGSIKLDTAEEVRRPGIVICEGICKRIQESDFITCDISQPNPNVFYELGLAYGIGQKIVVMHQSKSEFGKNISIKFKDLGCNCYVYDDLSPIYPENLNDKKYVWKNDETKVDPNQLKILLFNQLDETKTTSEIDSKVKGDIDLDFQAHVNSVVGIAINDIVKSLEVNNKNNIPTKHLGIINQLNVCENLKKDLTYPDVRNKIDSAYCIIIRSGAECDIMSYFWLGYGHSKGKNVIPVNVLEDETKDVKDLAFDIRAQRHMFFFDNNPEKFEKELRVSLTHMVNSDFKEWSRKKFWDKMLGKRGEVSIFTGALHIDSFEREMIGDWDLRAASELTSYFAQAQYRAKIESPIYSPEYKNNSTYLSEYIQKLKKNIENKTCIIIASPDVNPLTEIMLGHIYKVPDEKLFCNSNEKSLETYNKAIKVIKEKKSEVQPEKDENEKKLKRFFYEERFSDKNRRGFEGRPLSGGSILSEEFISQTFDPKDFEVLGNLIIAKNPRTKGKYIIILNGISGPATFALTHVITGGITKEFVKYDPELFLPEVKSEEILSEILEKIDSNEPLQYIISVQVGGDPNSGEKTATSDWRNIKSWEENEII